MMKLLKKILLLTFFAFLGINVSAQKAEASFVFIKDEDLIEVVKTVMNRNDFCNKGLWIIQINKEGEFDLTKGQTYYKKSEYDKTKNREQFVTTIGDEMFFIFTKERFNTLFDITEFKVDLKPLLEMEYIPFSQFSYWKIFRNEDSYSIKDKYIHKCN